MKQVVLAELKDLESIVKIEGEVFGDDSRRKYLTKSIEKKRCLVAKTDGEVVGFLIYNTDFFDCSFISLVIVSPRERRKGYAKTLMEYFETVSPTNKIFSSTNQSNIKMQEVFQSVGYVQSGYVENLDVGDPELIYFKQLSNIDI